MAKMLFIGGPRHGGEIDDTPGDPIDATDPQKVAATHPSTYIDISTATTYLRRRLFHFVAHPLTGKPTGAYFHDVWVLQGLDANQANAALFDVLMRRWFMAEARVVELHRLTTPPTHTNNGRKPPE